MTIAKYLCHSKKVLSIAKRFGWCCGARYTNLRDIRHEPKLGFLDIDWRNYSFDKHLDAARLHNPTLTVARDIENQSHLPRVLEQASALNEFAENVIIVPKDERMAAKLLELIPEHFILGFSVPTRYGGTKIPTKYFKQRKVHLLGGRPDVQRKLADELNVVSIDTNRFTLDAAYGDYFDGKKFKPHPTGGYENCLNDSLKNINRLWVEYRKPSHLEIEARHARAR